jgi:hypothetical protein
VSARRIAYAKLIGLGGGYFGRRNFHRRCRIGREQSRERVDLLLQLGFHVGLVCLSGGDVCGVRGLFGGKIGLELCDLCSTAGAG